jgi:hypothetical protein
MNQSYSYKMPKYSNFFCGDKKCLNSGFSGMDQQQIPLKHMDTEKKQLLEKLNQLSKKFDKEVEMRKIAEAQLAEEKAKNSSALKEKQAKLIIDLEKFRLNLTIESGRICAALQELYTKSCENEEKDFSNFIRRAYQLSIIGIVWTEALKVPLVERQSTYELKDYLKLSEVPDVWNQLDDQDRNSVWIWVSEFYLTNQGKPEANISQNLWGYVLRKLLISVESSVCSGGHVETNKLQCFSEYSTENMNTIRGKFYTDMVFLADCTGSPIFFVELAADPGMHSRGQGRSAPKVFMHKDLKKMAIQMAAALLDKIDLLRKLGKDEKISSLRVFGALIFGAKIEFCLSRPIVDAGGKFHILFETNRNEWYFDLFESDSVQQSVSQPEYFILPSKLAALPVTVSETQSDRDVAMDFEMIEGESAEASVSFEVGPVPNATRFGVPSNTAIRSISKFIGVIHNYYRNFDNALIYLNPKEDEDPALAFPSGIHDLLSTKAGNSPILEQKQFFELQSRLTMVPTISPNSYICATLPVITYTLNDSNGSTYRFDKYLQGIGLIEFHNIIENVSEDDLADCRIFSRSRFILGIVVAILKAHEYGFVFESLSIEDFTYRNDLFCILTYKNICRAQSSSITVIDSLKSFAKLYCGMYALDRHMTEGDAEYADLRKLESSVLGRIQRIQADYDDFDWCGMINNAKLIYQNILDSLRRNVYEEDPTFVLLTDFLNSSGSKDTPKSELPHSESLENANPNIPRDVKLVAPSEPKAAVNPKNVKFI